MPELPGVLAYGATQDEAHAERASAGAPCGRRASRPWRWRGSQLLDISFARSVSSWPSSRAKQVLLGASSSGLGHQRQSGSHRTLSRPGWPDYVFAFHDGEELGPRMLARIAKHTGLTPDDVEIERAAEQGDEADEAFGGMVARMDMPPHARAGQRHGRGHRFAAYPRCSADAWEVNDDDDR